MAGTFDRNAILQGNRLREENTETPATFAYYNGEVVPSTDKQLDRTSGRMAGPVGARAQALRDDPVEYERTAKWMDLFGLSNPGAEFNEAKMIEAQGGPQALIEEEESA